MADIDDAIQILGMRLRCNVGVSDEERSRTQELVASVRLKVDLRRAGRTDELADTVDYASLADEITAAVEGGTFRLIESVAQTIADICLQHAAVGKVTVVVEKPGALPRAERAAVRIVRSRPHDV